jgi:Tfp pilus assembly protein PilO
MTLNLKTVDRLCLAVVVLAALFLGVWFLKQGVAQERLLKQEKQRVTKSMEDLQRTDRNIEQLKGSMRATAGAMTTLSRQIPDSAQIGEFLKGLDGIVKKRGVMLISVQPQPQVKEKIYQKIPVRVTCKGPFSGLYQMLQDIEEMDRFILMDKMIMGKGESGECQLDLNLLLFTREPAGQAVPATTGAR